MKVLDTFLPQTMTEYREPFVGGGSVFLHARQKYGADVDYWINDKYHNLYCFWKTLRDHPEKMIKTLLDLKVKNAELNSKKDIKETIEKLQYGKEQKRGFYKSQTQKGRQLFLEAKEGIEKSDEFWKGVYFYILNKCSYSGLTENGTFSPQASIQNFSVTGIRKLRAVAELLQGVKITNLDYANVLDSSENTTFIFLDPPYNLPVKQSNALYGKNGELHKGFDHLRLYHYIATNLGEKMITYNNTQELRDLYRNFKHIEWSLRYGMRIVANEDGELKAKDCTNNELLITTYSTICQYRQMQKKEREEKQMSTKKQLLKETRKAINEVFGDYVSKETVNKSVYLSEDDAGGWAPEAHVIICTEMGLSSDVYDPFLAEKWHQVSEKLPNDYFIETINGAIMAVYDI